ncbi:hypothetical protein JL100_024190 [Skermanella mucosa]|uniref:hypothetical protein n=1 Tax=Skermanella mucosa TaxID=1789672 RepID=UPI00192AFA63|nr:hypothetical protein [Skermanella mucosa]UEM20144.1 hypothetical protein JL100_024190 [Skermanella mucosa]
MVAQMRADVVVDTMTTIARKIDGMDTCLTEGQARLEKRLDGVVEEQVRLRADIAEFRSELKADIAEVRTELKADIAIVAENIHSFDRKLNTLLAHMGLTE